jgi:hypothetical protein
MGILAWCVIWRVTFTVRTCTYLEVPVVQYALEPSLNYSSDVPMLYVLPIESHKLELVTSTCTMSCNVLLQDCTRHTRTLPPLTYLWGQPRS